MPSNSWGGGPPSDLVTGAFERAGTRGRNGRGAVVIVAAGNNQSSVLHPGNLPEILTVGASNQWDALVVAAAWELTPAKRRWLRACHRTLPLPPDGWRADAACARFGLRYGQACVGACWALMLAMAIAGHAGLLLMIVLAAIVVAEEVVVKGSGSCGARVWSWSSPRRW